MRLTAEEKAQFESYLEEATQAAFEGWDFSYMRRYGGDMGEPNEWSYEAVVRRHIGDTTAVLDMGTGGGEFFASLQPLPAVACATEAYPPNIGVARGRLAPLGVEVIGVDRTEQEDYPLPFAATTFDLVLNRHESYEAQEVYRVLSDGGTFITQQVGSRDHEDLRLILGTLEDDTVWTLDACLCPLREAAFTIVEAREHIGYSRFYDIRALVYLVKALPWVYPDFDTHKYRRQLLNLHIKILTDGYFDAVQHRFFVIARKEVQSR